MWAHSILQLFLGVHFTHHLCSLLGCLEWCCVWSLSAAWSQMAWCGWLWLRLLSPPDHHMMNHIPVSSKTTHTQTRTDPPVLSTAQSGPSKRNNCPLRSSCMEINFNKPSRSSQQQCGEQEKQKIHQGAKGRREKTQLQPFAVRSLFLSLCDLCPWPGPIHVPQTAQLMPQ